MTQEMKLQNEMFTIVAQSATGKSEIYFRIRLNAGHFIYKAHFPGNPITPGVCLVKILTELTEKYLSRQLFLIEINNLKFISTISPIEDTVVEVAFSKICVSNDFCKVKGIIFDGDKIYIKFSFTYGYNQL